VGKASDRKYGKEVDWWALGCVVFEMLKGEAPFGDQGDDPKFAILNRINAGKVTYPNYFSKSAINLITGLLHTSPDKRFTFKEVHDSPWFSEMDWLALLNQKLTAPFIPEVEPPGGHRWVSHLLRSYTHNVNGPW